MDIFELINREKGRCSEMITLRPRFQRLDESTSLSADEKAMLEQAWYSFHERAGHTDFMDFFDKTAFCRKYGAVTPGDEELFLSLISDKDFLFPIYSERLTDERFSPVAESYPDDPGLPPLSETVRAYDAYITNGMPKEKLDYVLAHPFIPYPKHKEEHQTWQDNLRELREAKELREDQMQRLHPEFSAFSCTIPEKQPREELSEDEELLCEIFEEYVRACVKYAYESRLTGYDSPSKPWRTAVHTVYQYLKECEEPFDGYKVIVFFHLFSHCAKKLVEGTLRQYHFGPLKERVSKEKDPAMAQRKISGRIQCNIQLFDLLAEVWSMTAAQRQDLKYIFYVYSRYDRYWHYEVKPPKRGFISFTAKEDYKDGVDHFGNLLRYRINYCIPISAEWLLPVLTPKGTEDPLITLSTFLLSEAVLKIPAQERISARIKAYQDGDEWRELLKEYRAKYTNPAEVRDLLSQWVNDHHLTFPHEEELLYEGQSGRNVAQHGGQYILEFALRMDLIREARENLGKVAKSYFDSLCLDGFTFADHKPVKPVVKRLINE